MNTAPAILQYSYNVDDKQWMRMDMTTTTIYDAAVLFFIFYNFNDDGDD